MQNFFKKILVFLPVFILTCFFLRLHYNQQYRYSSDKRLFALAVTVILLYAWIIIGIIRRKQDSVFQVLLQSSFYVYIFCVLTLTGYFILFKEVSAYDWWQKMLMRIARNKGVNFVPLKTIKMLGIFSYQVVGNFLMLLPLGIYLPLLYKKIHGFFIVTFICMLVSVCIELMQLVTNFRITDVDDVILNTIGAALGYIIYLSIRTIPNRPVYPSIKSDTILR